MEENVMENLYIVEAQESFRDNITYYISEVVASCRHKAQIIATEELHDLFSIWGSLDFDVTDYDEAKDQPRFRLIYISDYGGNRTCWGCGQVTELGEKDQCECKK
jgi:hypothetical protein